MDIAPGFSQFASAYEEGRPQALYARLIADLETPVSAFLKLADGRANAFLLESVQGGETRGRYSIICLKPDLIWRCRDGKAEINRNAEAAPDRFVPDDDADKPLLALKRLVKSVRMELPLATAPATARQSVRSARIGEIEAARRAGRMAATNADAPRAKTPAASAIGSQKDTP